MTVHDHYILEIADALARVKGGALSQEEEDRLKQEIKRSEDLRPLYEELCQKFKADEGSERARRVWELITAVDDNRIMTARGLLELLDRTMP